MSEMDVRRAVRVLVEVIAAGEFRQAVDSCSQATLSADDLTRITGDYGRTLVTPPAEFEEVLDMVVLQDRPEATWSIAAPLWTREEGRSDLTLELTAIDGPSGVEFELDDLRVL